MDKIEEQKLSRFIVRGVAVEMRSHGFSQSKPTFLTRPLEGFVQFMHFHKFTFGPKFRLHLGVRVLNDPFPAIALNGPSFEHAGKYDEFEGKSLACTLQLVALIEREALPWFQNIMTVKALLKNKALLHDRDRAALLEAESGRFDSDRMEYTKGLLGLRKSLSNQSKDPAP